VTSIDSIDLFLGQTRSGPLMTSDDLLGFQQFLGHFLTLIVNMGSVLHGYMLHWGHAVLQVNLRHRPQLIWHDLLIIWIFVGHCFTFITNSALIEYNKVEIYDFSSISVHLYTITISWIVSQCLRLMSFTFSRVEDWWYRFFFGFFSGINMMKKCS